jgi:hypothetical protein
LAVELDMQGVVVILQDRDRLVCHAPAVPRPVDLVEAVLELDAQGAIHLVWILAANQHRKLLWGVDERAVGIAELGGLIRDNTATGDVGVPWFKDIPLFGSLLRTDSRSNDRTELVVLITPRAAKRRPAARRLRRDTAALLQLAGRHRQPVGDRR